MDAGNVDGSLGGEILILKGSQRSGAKALADHLMNDRDNDHVTCLDLRGFSTDQLHGALAEMHAISKATQCKKFMFSLSLNPPQDHIGTEEEFLDAADRAEQQLGLTDQPRAIVVHEKEGRRHAHVVWSRIDVEELKAIHMGRYKLAMRDLSRDLFLEHGWVLPDGLAAYGNKSPLNFTLEEWQQAKRQGLDPREIKQAFQQAWERSDNQLGFKNALEGSGYFLARGDRRGFVALDVDGNVHSIAKWAGLKAKDVKAKLGSSDNLPSVAETQSNIRSKVSDQMRGYIAATKKRHQNEREPLQHSREKMVKAQRDERQKMLEGQSQRYMEESNTRQNRFASGVRGLVDRVSGKRKVIEDQNIREAMRCAKRDQEQRNQMITAQLLERQDLQTDMQALKDKQRLDRNALAGNIRDRIKLTSGFQERYQNQIRSRRRDRGVSFDI